ncbi:tubulin nucleotide-binding domain-like protein [Rhizoclosmatium globosum]|uniref:Tubulin nucleotide-binding domain-like protein n=1 Tax=Rhizoclosmatium globosum TaxID=329046 RepID=A0A1Y2CK15_9FUNG|nr:tubulin nucleotide-binding domain-like protein [Rhizoclosmatium globosum]|eukprot:ORY47352.1 tubulin nucleotide-binding domain-like protein [Rhizoclosmatium globosum]
MAAAEPSQTLATSTFFEKHRKTLRARAVLVDMEEGVVGQTLTSPLGSLFGSNQVVASNSGSGNNWGVGYRTYGTEYGEELSEKIRAQAEVCDSLQSFFMMNSLGGGTGTDCVLPVENQALIDIYNKVSAGVKREVGSEGTKIRSASGSIAVKSVVDSGQRAFGGMCAGARKKQPFDEMNNIVANLIINLTSSMRFEGSMNVDINDIVTNLFLLSSMTPLFTLADVNIPSRRLDQMFTDAFSKDFVYILACALMIRGQVEVSDIRRNVDRAKSWLQFVPWNQDGQTHSLLTLSNNTCIADSLDRMRSRFMKLYKRKRIYIIIYSTLTNKNSRMHYRVSSLSLKNIAIHE